MWDDRKLEGLPTFESVVQQNLPGVTVQEVLESPSQYWILDVRSEAEFEQSHLPGAVSFPILDNEQRREVGLLYKHRGRDCAVQRALEFAEPKLPRLRYLVEEAVSTKKTPLIYCWRGGGRSAYTTQEIARFGFRPLRLIGGHKAYRKRVYQSLYQEEIPPILILKGLTGVGKTDLLHHLSSSYRVLDLEHYAKHCASSFGSIPYELSGNYQKISQKRFEDGVYQALYLDNTPISRAGILAESESKRIGRLLIPPKVFESMTNAKTIEIRCSLQQRVERIYLEYIGLDQSGIPLLQRDLQSIAPYVSKVKMAAWLEILKKGKIKDLLKDLLVNYYDQKYAGIYQEPILQVDATDLDRGVEEILNFLG